MRVELVVPRSVERVRDVDATAVAAHLDHLRPARQPLVRRRGVRDPPDDPAEPHRAHLARVRRVRHVVLLELAGAPARDVEHAVVDGEVDVGDQRRDGAEGLQRGRQQLRVRGLGRDRDHLVARPTCRRRGASARPTPTGPRSTPPPRRTPRSPRGSWRRAQLQHHLVLRTEVDRLQVPALGEVPEVQRVAVLLAQQQLGHDAVLDHRRRAPLAGDRDVLVEVPPGVVGQVLRAAVGLPGPQHVERGVVEQRDPARPVVAVRAAEARQEDPVGAAVQGVRARVAGVRGQLLGVDRLEQVRRARVGLRVVDVDVAAAQPRAAAGSAARGRACRGPRA